MKLLLAILLGLPLTALAQFGAGVAAGGWEPLNIVTKAAIVACYDAGNSSTITLNGTGVQQLRSRVVGVTNHLNQATAGNQPRYDTTNTLSGRSTLYFDGLAYYLQTASFTWSQPEEVWILMNPYTWTITRIACDGLTSSNRMALVSRTNAPLMVIYANAYGPYNTNMAQNAYNVFRSCFNGANSLLEINGINGTSGNVGSDNANGFTLGSRTDSTIPFKMQFAYGILCSKTNNTPEANFLRTCLMRRAGL